MRVRSAESMTSSRSVLFSALAILLGLILISPSIAMKDPEDKPDKKHKPAWRVIDDAPFRIIPGLPVLVSKGEPEDALGDDLFIDNRSQYTSVAFSPDGRFIAAGAEDGCVRLWDIQTKRLVHKYRRSIFSISSIAFSPDGQFIVAGTEDGYARLWDIQAMTPVHLFEEHGSSINSVAFSPGGQFIATGAENGNVRLWDIQAMTLVHLFEGHGNSITSVTFSPEGRFIAAGSRDDILWLWDIQTKTLAHFFEIENSRGIALDFSPNGRFIAVGEGYKLQLWNIQNKNLEQTFEGPNYSVDSVAFSPDGRFIASGGILDSTLQLWDTQTNALVYSFKGHTGDVDSVDFSPDGRFIASANDDTVRLWDIQTKSLVHIFDGHTYSVTSVDFSPNGRFVASGSWDNILRLWDIHNKQLTYNFEGHTDSIISVDFSPDGRFIASGSSDDTVRLWDIKDKKLVYTFEGHTHTVYSVKFSPDGRFIASGSSDDTVRLWDIKNKKLTHTFKGHTHTVHSVNFSPDGRFIASGSEDHTVRLWDIPNERLAYTLEELNYPIRSVIFSPDGRFIAAGTGNQTVLLWDSQSRKLAHTFKGDTDPSYMGLPDSVLSLDFSPNGRFIVAGDSDNNMRLWDSQSRKLLHTFHRHYVVYSVKFSPDGRFIASGGRDHTVQLWDIQTHNALQVAYGGKHGNWLIQHDGTIWRGDDGTFLKAQERNLDIQPVIPKGLIGNESFIVSSPKEPISILPGESLPITLKIENTGSTPIFWLHLKPSMSDDGIIRIDPPHQLLTGKGRQTWQPALIARLDPGRPATIHARITPNMPVPADLPEPGTRSLDLTVASANSIEVTQTINVDLKSPHLACERARMVANSKILQVDLHNTGNIALRNFSLSLQPDMQNAAMSAETTSTITTSRLNPGETTQLPLPLPENFDLEKDLPVLVGRTTELPIFQWRLTAPEIEHASRLLYWLLVLLAAAVMIGLFFLRRYRHPLVVQLSENPKTLLRMPPEQLAEARERLRQTGRLSRVLSEAEVTPDRLDNAIDFFETASPEQKARQLAGRMRIDLEKNAPGLWKLRFPGTFQLNMDHCLLHFSERQTPSELFIDVNNFREARYHPTLLIGPDSDVQRHLQDRSRDRTNKLVTPSGPDLTRLLLSPEPMPVLAGILASQLSLKLISPYQLGGGINRETVFFGRREIIAHIMNRDPANYLLVSGRQLGKSSLLKALYRRYADHPDITCLYRSLSNEVLVPRLAKDLGLPRNTDLEGIADFFASAKRHFLVLIDEADKFIRKERQSDYQILDSMRRMSEEGHCHFILAGFWELYQHAVLDYQSPLKNFADIIQIGELEKDACRQMATEPMANLRLNYADPTLVDRLLAVTGQRANLMAIACQAIIDGLQPNQRIIESADIERALVDPKLFEALKGWAEMTDDEMACNMDRIIVYATIEQARFTYKQLIELLRQHELKARVQQIDHSLNRLLLGFVLGKDKDGGYFYRVPLFRRMIIKDAYQTRLQEEINTCQLD